jgi:lysophospholipid acyltransferase (LPLAT)-like uncharacterized protein
MLKSLLGNAMVQLVIGRTIGLYMHFVGTATFWRNINRPSVEAIWAGREAAIICIWHNRFMLVHKLWAFGPGIQKAKMLISQSREGGVVAHASRAVGAEVIRGSAAKGAQTKGGFEALREMLRYLRGKGVICMTPDGPRGPRMRAKFGPIQLAKLSGAPLLPLAWATRHRIVFQSWDRFVLPLPFGPGVRIWGNPIHVPRDADDAELERARLMLESELQRISMEADRLAGVDAIEPAPDPAAEPAPTHAAANSA